VARGDPDNLDVVSSRQGARQAQGRDGGAARHPMPRLLESHGRTQAAGFRHGRIVPRRPGRSRKRPGPQKAHRLVARLGGGAEDYDRSQWRSSGTVGGC
jgi:hypothetical protein